MDFAFFFFKMHENKIREDPLNTVQHGQKVENHHKMDFWMDLQNFWATNFPLYRLLCMHSAHHTAYQDQLSALPLIPFLTRLRATSFIIMAMLCNFN